MSNFIPPLVVGTVPLGIASEAAAEGVALSRGIDNYLHVAPGAVQSVPPAAAAPRLEESISFEAPDLRRIHLSGRGADPEKMIPQFPEARRLKNGRLDALALLWRQQDDETKLLWNDQYVDPEYVDPENPLKLGEDCAELANLSMRYRREVIALHHQLRRSLAEEATFEAVLRKDIRYSVRYRLVSGAEPVRDGTVPVDSTAVRALIERYERFSRPLSAEAKSRLTRGLILIDAVRGFQKMRRWTQPLTVASIAERLLPDWSEAEKKRAIFFQAVLESFQEGRSIEPEGGRGGSYWSVYKNIAQALDHPMEEMLRQVLGPAVERWKSNADLRMDFLKDLLTLCNFLKIREPWRIVWRLHRAELSWAFTTVKMEGGRTVFEIDPATDLDRLRESGFGGLLNAARLERGWNLPSLREAAIPHYGSEISLTRLGDIAANREQPEFKILAALVAALNAHPEALPLDRAEAFLAAYPTFIALLPLAARGESRILREPFGETVPFVPYAEPVEGASVVVTKSDGLRSGDPEGLPFLMRSSRAMRGWTVVAAAERLGISHETLRRYEGEPGEGERSLPGRITLSVICHADGYELSRDQILAAHLHSYWSGEASVAALRERTFLGPVFIEENTVAQVRAYAAERARTPGEILFYWRNGVPAAGDVPFLPTETDMAAFLGVPLALYRSWESNGYAPDPAQAEAMASRLGRSRGETKDFLEACGRLRAERAAELEGGRAPLWLRDHPNLANFAAGLSLRPFFLEANRSRFYEKLESLQERNPESLAFLEKTTGGGIAPDSPEALRVIAAVHRAEEKARLWPERISLSGPVAAYTYGNHRAGKKIWDRLTRALRNPRVTAVAFSPEDGTCAIEGLEPRGKRPAKLKFAPDVPSEDVPALTALIRRMKADGRLNNRERTKAFVRRIACLAEHDAASYRDFVAAAGDRADVDRLSRTLDRTARFVEQWKGRLEWSGSAFAYFDGQQGTRAGLMFLRTRLTRGNLKAVHFDGTRVDFEALKAPRRTVRRGGAARTFSYRGADVFRFLPNPKNRWGGRDLAASRSEVQERVKAFFERLEAKLEKSPLDIQRELGRTYYNVRSGADVMGGEYLSDEVLNRIGLDDRAKEELRHLQALSLLARGEAETNEKGPFEEHARLLRYYRFLHQIAVAETKKLYAGGPSVATPSDYEFGRVALKGRERLERVARGLGVPDALRRPFVDHLQAGYEAVAETSPQRNGRGLAKTFPNPAWEIPHSDWSESDALEALKGLAAEARGAIRRADLGAKTGLTASHLYKFENHGEISEDAWPLYRDYLAQDGREELAGRIRVARAVLDLRRKPLEEGGGFREAGTLLRFTRFLMIGKSVGQVMKDLRLDVDPQLYLRWEWGFNRMPDGVLKPYSRLLEHQGVLFGVSVSSFINYINKLYAI